MLKRAFPVLFVCVALSVCLPGAAQTDASAWQKETQFEGLDQNGLSPAKKTALLSVLRTGTCNCGCTMNPGTMDPTMPNSDGTTSSCWPPPEPCTMESCPDGMSPEHQPGDFGCGDGTN